MELENKSRVIVIILAAGQSARLGRPKQLLPYNGQTLLQNSIEAARASEASGVIVVAGANASTISATVNGLSIKWVVNEDWQEGMASSVRCGIKAAMSLIPELEGVVMMVCDQPFVTSSLLNQLINTHRVTGKAIVASAYGDTFGTPVFFHQSFFEKLLALSGDAGAKQLVRQYTSQLELVSFSQGNIDIDTRQDYERLTKAE